jgi:hypothetical protein
LENKDYSNIPESFNVDWDYVYDVDNELVFHYYPYGTPSTVWQLRFELMNGRQWKIAKIFEEAEVKYFIEIFTDLKQYESYNRIQYDESGVIKIDDIRQRFGKKVYSKVDKM